jgi:hypothetical protein
VISDDRPSKFFMYYTQNCHLSRSDSIVSEDAGFCCQLSCVLYAFICCCLLLWFYYLSGVSALGLVSCGSGLWFCGLRILLPDPKGFSPPIKPKMITFFKNFDLFFKLYFPAQSSGKISNSTINRIFDFICVHCTGKIKEKETIMSSYILFTKSKMFP